MRIAVVMTYPLYHAFSSLTVDEWLKQPDRERFLAAVMAEMGHQVELWAAGDTGNSGNANPVEKIEIPGDGFKTHIFPAVKKGKKTKYHYSEALVAHAREFNADIHILKGVDGGVGTYLLRTVLVPNRRSYAFIIGGEYYSADVPGAEIVFYETEWQKQRLESPGWFRPRKRVPAGSLIRLAKYIDTDLFCPMPGEEKRWDILVVGRLIPRYKNYDALGMLSRRFRVAVIGDGARLEQLKALYPGVEWLGYVPNVQLPRYYNRAHVFMHTGFRDYYPRVIAEALACGIPCVAYSPGIAPDVLPPGCGLLVPRRNFVAPIQDLLVDKERMRQMGIQARSHALAHIGKDACKKALQEMFARLETRPGFKPLT